MNYISKQYNAIFYNPNTTDPKKWRDINDSTLNKERTARILFIAAGLLFIIGSILGAHFGGLFAAKLLKTSFVIVGGFGAFGIFLILSGLMRNDARENQWPDPKIPSYKTSKSIQKALTGDVDFSIVSNRIFKGGRGLQELVQRHILTIDQAKIIAVVQDHYETSDHFNPIIWQNALSLLNPSADEGEKYE